MSQTKTYSLYELTNALRRCIEHSFDGRYWIRAEVSEFNRNRISGHTYLELIEKSSAGNTIAKMRAIIWAQTYRELADHFLSITGMAPAAGMEMLMLVSISYHEQFGGSLVIHNIDPTYTLGEAARRRQEAITRLQSEGLFEHNRRLPLPRPLQRLAIISSATAAGYEDFLEHLSGTAEGYQFYTRLYNASMQGEGTESSVLSALQIIAEHRDRYDAILIIRGGGAVSDLTAFDNYAIARAIALHPLPILTGIGHERDQSVADLVAAVSLKTPTAVADYIIELSRREDLLISSLASRTLEGSRLLSAAYAEQLSRLTHLLPLQTRECIQREAVRIDRLRSNLAISGHKYLALGREAIDRLPAALPALCRGRITNGHTAIEALLSRLRTAISSQNLHQGQRLDALHQAIRISHPHHILKRGFAIIRSPQGIVCRASDLPKDTDIALQFADSTVYARTTDQDQTPHEQHHEST